VNQLLQAELLKLRTTRTFVTLAAFAVGTSILVAGLVAALTEPTRDSVLVDVYASDTSRAKAIAFAAAGTALSVLTAAAVAVVGTVVLTIRDLPLPELGELLAQNGRNAVLAALLGAFGVGIGALVRNQIAAVVSLLLLALVVEPLVTALAPHVGRFGPLGALSTAAAGLPADAAGIPEEVQLFGVLPAILLLLAWIATTFTAAAALLVHRDLE
jgi:ABC-2 type transport system permease protein